MTFRDDRDALLARNDALEREVEDAKRALAETEAALERRAQPPGQPAGGNDRGRELAEALISGSPETIEEHLRELSGAPRPVRDVVGREFAAYLKAGGAMARAVCTLYAEHAPPRFQGSVHDKLRNAFAKATADPETRPLAERALAALGDGAQHTAKTSAGKSLVARILSVFTRPWVIVVFWLPTVFAVIAFATAPGARLILGGALVGYAVLVVGLDAFLRRCRSCRRWLAGIFLRVVRDQYDSHITSWRCTYCNHNWQTSRYAGPR